MLLYASSSKNSTISVWDPTARKLIRTYTGVASPTSMAFSPSGDLFVTDPSANAVSEYAAGSTTLLQNITDPVKPSALTPVTLRTAPNGNLYAFNGGSDGNFAEFDTSNQFVESFGDTFPIPANAALFDSSGNLYVSAPSASPNGSGSIIEVWQAGTGETASLQTGIANAVAMLMDSSNNLYVANSGNNTVTEYSTSWAGGLFTYSLINTFSQGIAGPKALLLDSQGNLVVANSKTQELTLIPLAGGSQKTIKLQPNQVPTALEMDSSGDICVGTESGLLIFPPGDPNWTLWFSPNIWINSMATAPE